MTCHYDYVITCAVWWKSLSPTRSLIIGFINWIVKLVSRHCGQKVAGSVQSVGYLVHTACVGQEKLFINRILNHVNIHRLAQVPLLILLKLSYCKTLF